LGPSCGVPDVPVEKYNNGNIRAEIYRGPDLPRGSYVRYYTSGKPAKIVFANETTFQGIQFSRGDYAEIDERTGKITKIATNHPVKIGEYTLAPVFRTDGSCGGFEQGIVFATNQDHGNVQFVELENGKLKKGVLAVGGIYGDTLELPPGHWSSSIRRGGSSMRNSCYLRPSVSSPSCRLKFDQRGRLSEAFLAEDMPVGRNSIVF
jgi:hypothetical protein